MVYGILRIINFAHGDVLMIGALIGLSVIRLLQAAWLCPRCWSCCWPR
ncbi:hypothetical protein [Pseudomonas chlororaphis]|nr:hypothetical protein [Pseudomonas chlororaphis]